MLSETFDVKFVANRVLTERIRLESLALTHRPIARFGSAAVNQAPYTGFALNNAANALPAAIHLHTRTVLRPGRLLIRLQHLFGIDEPGAGHLGKAVKVDLQTVLPVGAVVVQAEEYDMNGITPLQDVRRLDFLTCDANTGVAERIPQIHPSLAQGSTEIELRPMDIRTFIVDYHF
jgi:hypothetical protein